MRRETLSSSPGRETLLSRWWERANDVLKVSTSTETGASENCDLFYGRNHTDFLASQYPRLRPEETDDLDVYWARTPQPPTSVTPDGACSLRPKDRKGRSFPTMTVLLWETPQESPVAPTSESHSYPVGRSLTQGVSRDHLGAGIPTTTRSPPQAWGPGEVAGEPGIPLDPDLAEMKAYRGGWCPCPFPSRACEGSWVCARPTSPHSHSPHEAQLRAQSCARPVTTLPSVVAEETAGAERGYRSEERDLCVMLGKEPTPTRHSVCCQPRVLCTDQALHRRAPPVGTLRLTDGRGGAREPSHPSCGLHVHTHAHAGAQLTALPCSLSLLPPRLVAHSPSLPPPFCYVSS